MKRTFLVNKTLLLNKNFLLSNPIAGLEILYNPISNCNIITTNIFKVGFNNKNFNNNKQNSFLKIYSNNFCKKLPRHKKLTLPNLSPSMEKVITIFYLIFNEYDNREEFQNGKRKKEKNIMLEKV